MSDRLTDEPVAGIHRIAVPTPFAVGRINCYLLTGEPLTLVDTGPNSGTALDYLERGLAELGFRIEDLELVVLTHQHMDHEGLLQIIARRSGAEVAAFAGLAQWLANFRASTAGDDQYAQTVMRAHGIARRRDRGARLAHRGPACVRLGGPARATAERRRHGDDGWARIQRPSSAGA